MGRFALKLPVDRFVCVKLRPQSSPGRLQVLLNLRQRFVVRLLQEQIQKEPDHESLSIFNTLPADCRSFGRALR